MRRSLKLFALMIITALVLTGCGRTLIKDQSDKELSAVTMYLDLNSFVIEGAAVKNLDTGEIFYNKRYGWGREFFPPAKSFSYLSIGNIKAGRYSFNKILFWYFPPGEKRKKTMELQIPDNLFRFTVRKNDILYLGDLNFTILNQSYDEDSLNKSIAELAEKNFTVKKFRTFIPYRSSESDLLYVNGIEPYGGSALRPAEEFFLKFFISKKSDIPGWSEIAQRKLKDFSDIEREMIIREIESR